MVNTRILDALKLAALNPNFLVRDCPGTIEKGSACARLVFAPVSIQVSERPSPKVLLSGEGAANRDRHPVFCRGSPASRLCAPDHESEDKARSTLVARREARIYTQGFPHSTLHAWTKVVSLDSLRRSPTFWLTACLCHRTRDPLPAQALSAGGLTARNRGAHFHGVGSCDHGWGFDRPVRGAPQPASIFLHGCWSWSHPPDSVLVPIAAARSPIVSRALASLGHESDSEDTLAYVNVSQLCQQ